MQISRAILAFDKNLNFNPNQHDVSRHHHKVLVVK
jgi:hypothetical protein